VPVAAGEAELQQPAPSRTDAALVTAVQRGDHDAFELLVRRHLAAAHRTAAAIVGNDDDAEDVTQDSFMAALSKIQQCESPERFRAWLTMIVRNRSYDFLRRAANRHAGDELLRHIASSLPGPDRAAQRRELSEHLSAAIEALPDVQREVLIKHDYEGWLHREIAEQLGISVLSSRFNLHIARKAMRTLLSDHYSKESLL